MNCLASLLLLTACGLAAQIFPAPFATPSVKNGPKIVSKPESAHLTAPPGFTVEEFASGFERPRFMVEGPSGEILVSDTVANGHVYVVASGENRALLSGLDRPYGLAFWKDYLYVGEPTSIKRYKYDSRAGSVGKGKKLSRYAVMTKDT